MFHTFDFQRSYGISGAAVVVYTQINKKEAKLAGLEMNVMNDSKYPKSPKSQLADLAQLGERQTEVNFGH